MSRHAVQRAPECRARLCQEGREDARRDNRQRQAFAKRCARLLRRVALILTLLLAWFLWRVWRTRSGKSARVRELFHADALRELWDLLRRSVTRVA